MKIETFKTFFYRVTRRLLFKSRERYRFVCGTLKVLDLPYTQNNSYTENDLSKGCRLVCLSSKSN